jgi:hypothetical protein
MPIDFYMWGERGLVASFFADLYLTGDRFPRSVSKATIIIERDFSNKGFGHPDAVIRVDANGEPAVIIAQAKRGPYAKACRPRTDRGVRPGFNSSLNGQLELCYALALALEKFDPSCAQLIEPNWILNTAYAVERRGNLRRLKNPNVLSDAVAKLAGLPLSNYFFLTLTTDGSNPFSDHNLAPLFPELRHPAFGTQECWDEMKQQFGWINYSALENLSTQPLVEADTGRKLLFAKSWEINRQNMGSGMQLRSEGMLGRLTEE